MRSASLGGLQVSRIGLGIMGMSDCYTGAGRSEAEFVRTIHRALDLGITHLDTAEVYGEEVRSVASEVDATPAQVALAWLLARGDDIAPIPGTTRVPRVEENVRSDALALTPDQLTRLDSLTPPVGDRHDASGMADIDR